MEENKQIIEVEYDEEKVKEYQDNYIMEEEGIGADEATPYDTQTVMNEDSIEDLLDSEDTEVILDEEEGE